MYYVIQENLWNEVAFDKLIQILNKKDLPYKVVKVIPFLDEVTHAVSKEIATESLDKNICIFGATTLNNISDKEGWYGYYGVDHNFDIQSFYFKYLPFMFNNPFLISTLEIARPPFSWSKAFFIKPCGSGKLFPGEVYTDVEKFIKWRNDIIENAEKYGYDPALLNKDTAVMMAEAFHITNEYRAFIIDGRISTIAHVKQGQRLLKDQECVKHCPLFEYIEMVIKTWVPAQAFVLDIWVDSLGKFGVGEIGIINNCAWYGANVEKIITDLEDLDLKTTNSIAHL